ncbi:MAG TPA: protein phosphatase 2C domain-containing protein, partial [Microlunatus sp.]|nr:protein phosphatase 2C domain-containing protein [Microlunatus sp.]
SSAVSSPVDTEGSTTPPTDGTEHTIVVPPAEDGPAEQGPAGLNPLLGRFAATVAEANARIADLVAADYALEGMGTTVTGAVFDGQRIGLVHIGDSRAYLLRDGHLERLTHDHSWVQSLVDDGKISADEAAYHPHRSLLLKVLNGQPANDPDLTTVELRAGDRLLFCSDGLCGLVDDPRIGELAAHPDLEVAVTDLVDAALAAGGIDNITVILAEAVPDTGSVPPGDRAEDEDTAVRPVVAATVVLGAAAERDIPSVPRRTSLVPGLPTDDDEDEDDEDDTPANGTPANGIGAPPAKAPPATRDDESRYAPGPPARRPIIRTLLVGLAILLVAAAGLGAGYAWTRTQYFVGAAGDQVAIYQGLPDGIPGLQLAQVYEVQDLPVASLPPYYQAQVTAGIEVASVEAARVTVEQLREMARRCAQPTPSPRPTTTTTSKPTATPSTTTGGPSGTASAPTPTTSLTLAPPSTAAPTTPAPSPLPGQGC